jgi:cytidylate kinase
LRSMSKGIIVAIDGPAGSGKSTSAKLVAQKLGFLYIDTGAMYRAITYLAIKNNILDDEKKITESARQSSIVLEFIDGETKVLLNGENVSKEIRSPEVNNLVSEVSKIKELRVVLVKKQREMGGQKDGVVMEGRDIATVVFPDADVKIFLTASINQRTERRAKEFQANGTEIPFDSIRQNLEKRDKIDSSRDASPLTKAPDAVEIDTSEITIENQVNLILEEVKKAADKKGIKINLNRF